MSTRYRGEMCIQHCDFQCVRLTVSAERCVSGRHRRDGVAPRVVMRAAKGTGALRSSRVRSRGHCRVYRAPQAGLFGEGQDGLRHLRGSPVGVDSFHDHTCVAQCKASSVGASCGAVCCARLGRVERPHLWLDAPGQLHNRATLRLHPDLGLFRDAQTTRKCGVPVTKSRCGSAKRRWRRFVPRLLQEISHSPSPRCKWAAHAPRDVGFG
jgi:hypothetical protein